jgi:deoxyadenosine/deoxycytidine kinase
MKYNFITIEGNIGAGKTTLARVLAEKLNAGLILEEFAENPFLAKFYENPEKYGLPLELFFMAERYKQLKELSQTQNLLERVTVSDYMFTKCLLFAKVNLSPDEFQLYQKLFDIMYPQLPQPDILIYLHAPVGKLQQNIKKRNREYEQSIPDQYLLNIEESYTGYIKKYHQKTIFIDASNADFENNGNHIAVVLNALKGDLAEGQSYITLP